MGYSLSHSFGAVFDNPDLVVACVVGDGEAETGPLATAWHSNKFLDPATDGAVLPILHLNGYKISNPTLLARITREELEAVAPRLRLDAVLRRRSRARADARSHGGGARHGRSEQIKTHSAGCARQRQHRPSALADDRPQFAEGMDRARRWSMACRSRAPSARIRCRSPILPTHPAHLKLLEDWLRSYRPEELFDEQGRLKAGTGRARAEGGTAHGRESARQRRNAAARPADAGFPRLRGRRAVSRGPVVSATLACSGPSCGTWRS